MFIGSVALATAITMSPVELTQDDQNALKLLGSTVTLAPGGGASSPPFPPTEHSAPDPSVVTIGFLPLGFLQKIVFLFGKWDASTTNNGIITRA